MPLPNFLIIGAQKSGTAWLANRLRQHPDVFMFDYEIHYFDKDYNYSRGLVWYKTHFTGVSHRRAIGESTPDYLWANGQGVEGHLPNVHNNIHNALPEAKLIIVLRNPVERAISAVNHIIRSGRISPLHKIDDLLIGAKRHLVEGHGVIDYGRYCKQIKAYYDYFDTSQILIMIFEQDVVKDPVNGLKKVCEFLEIDPFFVFHNITTKDNQSLISRIGLTFSYYLPFSRSIISRIYRYLPKTKLRPCESTIRRLYEIYAPENQKLYELLGVHPVSWQME